MKIGGFFIFKLGQSCENFYGFAIASDTAAWPAAYVAGESGTRLAPSTRNAAISPVLVSNA
jgi:hypothetical protein